MSASRLLEELLRLGAVPNPPATSMMIKDAERRLGIRFPSGVSEFYRLCDGLAAPTAELSWDFYPLKRVIRLSEYRQHTHQSPPICAPDIRVPIDSLIIFCEVFFDAVMYAYCSDQALKEFGKFFGDQSGQIDWCAANSFPHFVEVFLAHHDDMLINCGQ